MSHYHCYSLLTLQVPITKLSESHYIGSPQKAFNGTHPLVGKRFNSKKCSQSKILLKFFKKYIVAWK